MFSCKVCLEKDRRIADLQSEVVYLREAANPAKMTIQMPAVHEEVNSILGGSADIPMPNPGDEEIEAEAMRLLTGTF